MLNVNIKLFLKICSNITFTLDPCDLSFGKTCKLFYWHAISFHRWRRWQNHICSKPVKDTSSCYRSSHEEQHEHTLVWRTVGHTGAILWEFYKKSRDTEPRDFPKWNKCGETCRAEVTLNNKTHMYAHSHNILMKLRKTLSNGFIVYNFYCQFII